MKETMVQPDIGTQARRKERDGWQEINKETMWKE
jgi:hypothetical protein